MWDERYSEEGYAYGTAPNGFLASVVGELQSPVLCLASGEGRNAVWLAEQGLDQPQDVFWGEGSLDEMCMALLGIAWQP